jgi:hypothetical protein
MKAVQAMFEVVEACLRKHAGEIIDAGFKRRPTERGVGGAAEQAPKSNGEEDYPPQ